VRLELNENELNEMLAFYWSSVHVAYQWWD